jgi:hypothetical protein
MSAQNSAGIGTFFRASAAAVQWRLMLLWLAALLIPTAISTLPFGSAIGQQLDSSLLAKGLATGFDTGAVSDLMTSLSDVQPMLASAFVTGLALTGLLLPFLAGMVITAIRSGRKPGFGELLQGGLVEYGRQFRLLIIGGAVVLLAFAAGSALMAGVGKSAEKAIVESDLDTMSMLANLGFCVLLAIAMSALDAARAQFAADSTLRSALKAYWRGIKQLVRRPIATLGLFVLITVVGLLLVALFGVLRLSVPGVLLGFLVTQLVVLATIWMRTARLYALTEVATGR